MNYDSTKTTLTTPTSRQGAETAKTAESVQRQMTITMLHTNIVTSITP